MTDSADVRSTRRALFTTEAEGYAQGRPGYPQRVSEILVATAGLGPGCEVVEVGPGTGQATSDLLRAGATVTAIELGPDLAAHLRRQLETPSLHVIEGAFEEVGSDRSRLPAGSFDLVTSATAFHWVPTERGLELCAELLRPGGWLALWWTVFGDLGHDDPFHDALLPIIKRWAPELADGGTGYPYALEVDERIAEIDADGHFEAVRHELIEWEVHHTADEIRALFGTFSPWLALDEPLRTEMLDRVHDLAATRFADRVTRTYTTAIYLARRQP